MSLNLVLIRGLPGSGKSTMAKKFAARGYEHFEADQYFEDEDGSYVFDWRALHRAHSQCLTKTSWHLADGKSCVVSNTFTTFEEIEPYLQAAESAGACVYISECTGDFGSIHDVPRKVIENMKNRWESILSILKKGNILIEQVLVDEL